MIKKNVEFCQLRKEAGLTQEELAKKLGLKQCSISNWETGVSSPDIPTVLKIADIFGVAVEKVLNCFA